MEIFTTEGIIEAEVIGEETKEVTTPIITFGTIHNKIKIRMLKLQERLPLILADMLKPLTSNK